MDIKQVVTQAQTFTELWRIAEKITPENDVHLTFWGSEHVAVPGYEGVLGIDDLAARVGKMLWQNREFPESERMPGKNLAKRIDLIYKNSDAAFLKCGFFKRVFLVLRKVFSYFFSKNTTRIHIPNFFSVYSDSDVYEKWKGTDYHGIYGGDNAEFDLYTKTQFRNAFGRDPDVGRSFKKLPDRWFAHN